MMQYISLQRKGPDWTNFGGSSFANDVAGKMLTFKASNRPSLAEMLAHPWFRAFGRARPSITKELLCGLMHFHAASRMEQDALVHAASHLPVDRLRHSMEIFTTVDKDCDGRLGPAELVDALAAVGVDPAEAQQAAQRLTLSGPLEFTPFVAALLWSQWKGLSMSGLKCHATLPQMDTVLITV